MQGRIHRREERLIRVAPCPLLARLDRAHPGVTSRLEVGSGVPLPRAVAAPDRAAGQAHSEVDPAIALLLAGRTHERARPDVANCREVRALAVGKGALERKTTDGVRELISHLSYPTNPSGCHLATIACTEFVCQLDVRGSNAITPADALVVSRRYRPELGSGWRAVG